MDNREHGGESATARRSVDDLDDVVAEFLVESLEKLDSLDQGIVELVGATQTQQSAGQLATMAADLQGVVSQFTY